jgi:peroxiredoxin
MAAQFEAAGAQVLGVSVDSPYCHREFARQRDIPFPLLSDFNKDTAASYGVLTDLGPWRGVAGRSVFVVGRDGVVRDVWLGGPGDLPDVDLTLDAARAAARA